MAIKWETPSGLLTILKEETEISDSVQVKLDKVYSDVNVEIISGQLPDGISLIPIQSGYSYGFIGTCSKINETKEYFFTLRAYNEREFSDRFFSIEITNKLPYFDNNQSVFECIESNYVSIQINMIDNDANDKIVKLSGTLPKGLNINDYGLIYGNAEEVDEIKSYKFVLGIERNGVIVSSKEFTININNIPEKSAPIWITEEGYIGQINFRDDSSLFVKAYDPNDYTNDKLLYEIVEGKLPENLILETLTGRISGTLTIQDTNDYYFIIRVSNQYKSSERQFYITTNALDEKQEIKWITESNLGSVKVGNQYYLEIEAESYYSVSYKLSYGELPDGLYFENGIIKGEVKYQDYKSYSFIIEATNGYRTINKEFTLTVEKGLGKNAVNCYLYINHEYDEEYTSLLSTLDKSAAYEPSNPLYKIDNKPKINICKMQCFDKTLLKDLLYYNRPLNIMWDKTYKKDYIYNDEVLFQVFYKGIIEYNSIDTVEQYTYNDGKTESVSIPSISGIRSLLSEKLYVEKLNKINVLYDLGSQEIIDISGKKYPHYTIYYDNDKKSYYAKSQDEVKYLDVYALSPESSEYKPVYATIKREEYIGDDNEELFGGDAFTQSFEDIILGGNAFTKEWEEIIDSNYGKYIIKPVKVFEEKLNTYVDYINYYVYEKGTTNLQENIIFTLSWKNECKFIILNGQIHHIGSIDNPWIYKPELNETPIHNSDIVLPYITDDDVNINYIQFFDIDNESIDVWKSKSVSLWQPNTQYIVGDIFVYNDVYYKVKNNYISSGIFDDKNLSIMSDLEIASYLKPYFYPTMNILFSKPNTNFYAYKELNSAENKGAYFTGRKMDFYEVHFSPIYDNNIDNFSIDFYNHIQERSPEFQLI